MWTFFYLVMFAAGFAACWFSKDRVAQALSGAEAYAKALESKAAAMRAVV
ncbi:hypothetical protein [Bradyrhizobium sp. Tv2a-2]|nr:hypothetical protein [Bradyrhizobium sp. Tv2a-2]